jgi:hypothetical protein
MSKKTASKKAPASTPAAAVTTTDVKANAAAVQAITAALVGKTETPAKTEAPAAPAKVDAKAEAKAKRDAERAARYPSAAKAEAAKETGKEVRKANPEAAKKAAEKPAKPVVAFVAQTFKPGKPAHCFTEQKRPRQGTALFAHTKAALHFLGMMGDNCPAIPEKNMLAVMGARAVSYHLGQNNLTRKADGTIALTPAGLTNFKARTVDNALANAFGEMLATGKVPAGFSPNDVRALAL